MVRILLLLTFFLCSSAKIAIAQSENKVANNFCDLREPETLEEQPEKLALRERNTLTSSSNRVSKQSTSTQEPRLAFNFQASISNPQQPTSETTITRKNSIAVAGIPLPSLWWAKQQFDPFGGRLISNWLTYPQVRQVDVTVNWQLWTLLDYLGRYRFINQFGTVAREYGYSLRIFNQQQQCLALYEYDDTTNPPKWKIQLEGLGQDSLQVKPPEN